MNNMGSGALRGAAHGRYQGDMCFKSVVQFRGTRANVTPSRPIKTAFPATITTKLTNSQTHHMEICCTKFNRNRSRNMDNTATVIVL